MGSHDEGSGLTNPTAAQTGATYDSRRGGWTFLADAYRGGFAWANPSVSTLSTASLAWRAQVIVEGGGSVAKDFSGARTSYLVPFPAEDERSFDLRRALATYVNPVQLIVDAYAEGCTGNVKRQHSDGLGVILEDIDLRGNSWGEHVEDKARWSAVYGIVATVIEAPKKNPAKSRREEIASGVRPYAIVVHPTAWAWVDTDEFGRVTEFAYVDQPYKSDLSGVGVAMSRTITVRVYIAACEEHPAGAWQIRKGTIGVGGASGGIESQRGSFSEIVDEGELDSRLNGAIPVRFLAYQRDTTSRYPLGNSLVEDAAHLARCIYNKRSWEQQIAREAGFPVLMIPTGKTGGQLDPTTTIALGTSRGVGYDSTTGAPNWAQPSAEWAKDLRESSGEDFQFALRSAGLELAANASASAQTAEALQIKSRDYEKRAARFARNLQRDEVACLKLIALLAGEPEDAITVTYPNRFTLPDMAGDLDRALKLLAAPFEIGKSARIEAQMQAINAAVTLSDEKQGEVRDELDGFLDSDLADYAKQREVTAATSDAKLKELTTADAIDPAAAAPTGAVPAEAAEGKVEIFSYDYDADVLTLNEARDNKGLGPLPGGDVTITIWKAMQQAEAAVILAGAGMAGTVSTPSIGGTAPTPPKGKPPVAAINAGAPAPLDTP